MEKVYFNNFKYLRQKVYYQIKDYSQYKGIVCPLYGGVYLADYIRRQTKLPLYFLRLESYNEQEQREIRVHSIPYLEEGKYLIIDDIYDTGKTIEWIKNNNIDNVTYYSSSFPFGLVILYNTAKGKLKDLFPIKVFEYIVDTYLKPSNKAMKVNYIKDLMNEKEWSKKNEIYSGLKQ